MEPVALQFACPYFGGEFVTLFNEYDGTEARAIELLQQVGQSGWFLKVGDATPESWAFGILSLKEKEIVETSAQLVENDYFVRCEDDGVGRRRLMLSSGKTIETKKEVVLVNCRTSMAAVWHQDLHPIRPDGSIQVGRPLLGTTGQSAYALTLLHLLGDLDISFYGTKHPMQGWSGRSAVERAVIFTGNMMFKVGPQLGIGEMRKMTLSPDYWFPEPRKLYASGKLIWNADKIKAVCETTLKALQPFQ